MGKKKRKKTSFQHGKIHKNKKCFSKLWLYIGKNKQLFFNNFEQPEKRNVSA